MDNGRFKKNILDPFQLQFNGGQFMIHLTDPKYLNQAYKKKKNSCRKTGN